MDASPRTLLCGLAAVLGLCLFPIELSASSLIPTSEAEDVRAASAICIGRVQRIAAIRDPQTGEIFSRIRIVPLEVIKGKFAGAFDVIQPGGRLGPEGETNGLSAQIAVGEERLFFLTRSRDGSVKILRGFAGVYDVRKARRGHRFADPLKLRRLRQLAATESTAISIPAADGTEGTVDAPSGSPANVTGLLNDAGIPNRFVGPDRGEPIGYLVDTQALPSGISEAQALNAVSSALAAWTAVTGVTFRFDGTTNFGLSAKNVTTSDERIRIQLHDLFNSITDPNVLGIGGSAYNTVSNTFATTGGGGGQVNGLEFHKTTRGYVVLEHSQATLQNATSLAEVLCHEIGHVLGMAHSSENSAEPDSLLNQAIMYYRAHADGRGATLGAYDPPIVQKVHPQLDTPPYSYDRIIPLVTAPVAITTVPGVNEAALVGYDRQTASSALTLVTSGTTAGSTATFSFSGSTIRLTQTGYYSDNSVDPATTSFFALKWIRFSDGVNASPWNRVRVVRVWSDSAPVPRDGLPDSWMTTYFGSITPSAAALSRASDDKDGDGLTNLTEFLAGTNPTDRFSLLAVTGFDGSTLQWNANPYLLYLVESSNNLSTWSTFGNPVVPTTTTGQASGAFVPSGTSRAFYRVRLAP